MHKLPVNFQLFSTDYTVPLAFTLYHNEQVVYSCKHVLEPIDISVVLNHGDEDQTLIWEMSGKLPEHTQLSDNGIILNDAALITNNFRLDNFELNDKLNKHCIYYHNHNGTTEITSNTYDNYMGCNGSVVFKFSSPAYVWILKNW